MAAEWETNENPPFWGHEYPEYPIESNGGSQLSII